MTTTLIPPGPSRRRAGGALLTYGIVGVLVMGILFIATLAVAVMGRDGFTRLDDSRDEIVAVLDSTRAALVAADDTLTGVGVSLDQTSTVIEEAVNLSGILSNGATTLAEQAGSFSLLGSQPFGGIVGPLQDAAVSLDSLGQRLQAAGVALADNAAHVTTLGQRLGDVAESLGATRDRLANMDTQLGGAAFLAIAVVLAIIAWLAVPAFVALWVGRRWRRENPAA